MAEKIPDQVLDMELDTTAGKRRVRDLLDAEKPTVFIAYPGDFTPVCTAQLCHYSEHWEEFERLGCIFWGVNQFPIEKHIKFKERKEFPFDLITDPKGDLLEPLGLWGILRTRRGFAVVSPGAEILATTSIFPFFYQKSDQVIEFLKPYLQSGDAGISTDA